MLGRLNIRPRGQLRYMRNCNTNSANNREINNFHEPTTAVAEQVRTLVQQDARIRVKSPTLVAGTHLGRKSRA